MITALLAGDAWLAPSLFNSIDQINVSLRQIVRNISYDIFICNLEAPCISEQIRPHRRALLYTEPSLLDSLKIADKNILTLANNHLSDFGREGLLRTIDDCKKRGFFCVGAGATLDEARKPVVIEVKGRKIAMMSYADTAPHVGAIPATKSEAGIAPLDVDMILEDIANAKYHVDDIWLFLHWGREFIRYPMPKQRQISRRLIEAGAGMIIGHHPHVLLGCEKIDHVYVYYSLGNFVFPDIPLRDQSTLKWNMICRESIVLNARFERGSWSIDREYLFLNNFGLPEPSANTEAVKTFEKLSRLISDKHYSKRYTYYYLSEKIRNLTTKSADVKKLLKDIRWRFYKER